MVRFFKFLTGSFDSSSVVIKIKERVRFGSVRSGMNLLVNVSEVRYIGLSFKKVEPTRTTFASSLKSIFTIRGVDGIGGAASPMNPLTI